MIWGLEQNKPPIKTEALHCRQTFRNFLTSISEMMFITAHCIISKRFVGSQQKSDFYFSQSYFCVYVGYKIVLLLKNARKVKI